MDAIAQNKVAALLDIAKEYGTARKHGEDTRGLQQSYANAIDTVSVEVTSDELESIIGTAEELLHETAR